MIKKNDTNRIIESNLLQVIGVIIYSPPFDLLCAGANWGADVGTDSAAQKKTDKLNKHS